MNPPTQSPQLFALYHVNQKTGERVRHPRESFPATDKTTAEQLAKGSRQASAVVPNHTPGAADWQTEAHPETPE